MKRIGAVILWIVGVYFVVRAIAEPFVIDLNDPATYRDDWGGPSLTGVLLVHCGLGLAAAALMAWRLMRRSSVRLRRGTSRQAAAPRIPGEPGPRKEPGAPRIPHKSGPGQEPDVRRIPGGPDRVTEPGPRSVRIGAGLPG